MNSCTVLVQHFEQNRPPRGDPSSTTTTTTTTTTARAVQATAVKRERVLRQRPAGHFSGMQMIISEVTVDCLETKGAEEEEEEEDCSTSTT